MRKIKRKDPRGGGANQHTKFIMLYVLFCFFIITGEKGTVENRTQHSMDGRTLEYTFTDP